MSKLDLCQRCRESGVSGWSDPWVHCHHKPEEETLTNEVKRQGMNFLIMIKDNIVKLFCSGCGKLTKFTIVIVEGRPVPKERYCYECTQKRFKSLSSNSPNAELGGGGTNDQGK